MTDIERKALALLNEVNGTYWVSLDTPFSSDLCEALCRAIEQHEAFRQEVSDAVEAVFAGYHDAPIPWVVMRRKLEPFIIAKRDPLVEALNAVNPDVSHGEGDVELFRAALAARGLEIRSKTDG